MMKDETQQGPDASGWALPASLAIHLLGGAILLFGLPAFDHPAPKEKTIKVDLVAPPKPVEKAVEKSPRPKRPEPEKKQEKKAAEPPAADKDTPPRGPIPVLRPVLRFGEKDAGTPKPPSRENAKDGSVSPPASPRAEGPSTANGQGASELKEAKTLFSQKEGDDSVVTTAMRNIPRSERIGRLCATELRDQLLNASPPYLPELLPFFRLKAGTVMDVPESAFQAGGQWYDLSFRCEVDAGAKEVVSFAFRIGRPIPHNQWKGRGLPSR